MQNAKYSELLPFIDGVSSAEGYLSPESVIASRPIRANRSRPVPHFGGRGVLESTRTLIRTILNSVHDAVFRCAYSQWWPFGTAKSPKVFREFRKVQARSRYYPARSRADSGGSKSKPHAVQVCFLPSSSSSARKPQGTALSWNAMLENSVEVSALNARPARYPRDQTL